MQRNMTDIHMHLIPGVDDGAEDMEMAMVMLLRATQQGIHRIFATPHCSAFDGMSAAGILEKLSALRRKTAGLFPDLEIYPGCEIYCERSRMDRIHTALQCGKYLPMHDTNYVLIEFSKWVQPEDAAFCTEQVLSWGYIPILAHMERYVYWQGNRALIERIHELGAAIQVNVYSLYDESDDTIRNWARQLVLERHVTFLGTDAHRTYFRPPSAQMGLQWLYETCDAQYADAIAWENADRFLTGRNGG